MAESGSVSDQAIRDIVAQLVGGGGQPQQQAAPMGYPAPAVPEVTPAMSFMLPQQQAAMRFSEPPPVGAQLSDMIARGRGLWEQDQANSHRMAAAYPDGPVSLSRPDVINFLRTRGQ